MVKMTATCSGVHKGTRGSDPELTCFAAVNDRVRNVADSSRELIVECHFQTRSEYETSLQKSMLKDLTAGKTFLTQCHSIDF